MPTNGENSVTYNTAVDEAVPEVRIVNVLKFGVPKSLKHLFQTAEGAYSAFTKAWLLSRLGLRLPEGLTRIQVRRWLKAVPVELLIGTSDAKHLAATRAETVVPSAEDVDENE
jgi:hypothetical protein